MVFLGDNINQKQKPIILAHELVHVKHKHSIDLLVFEILRIIMWFNPLIYMYHIRIRALHEYIADAISAQQSGKSDYYQSLLHQVFDTNEVSFANTFFKKSLIKKRIKMLQKSKSKQVKLIKYALLLPIVFGMLIYTSVEVKAQEKQINYAQSTDSTENELVEKYYNEIRVLKEREKNLKILTQYRTKKNKFKMSLDEFARDKAYFKTIFVDTYYEKKSKGKIKKKNKEAYDKLLEYYNRTYKEYLEHIKTE